MCAEKRRAAVTLIGVNFAESEIDKLHVSELVKHQIVGLQVAIHNVLRVQILKSQQNFADVDASNFFRELAFFFKHSTEIPSWTVLQQQEHIFCILKGKIHFDYKVVICHG